MPRTSCGESVMPGLRADRDRRGRGLLRRRVERRVGRGDVHARGFDRRQSRDRALQLAFGRADLRDLFLRVGHAEVRAVEQLVAGAAAFDHVLAGEVDPLVGDDVRGDVDGRAVGARACAESSRASSFVMTALASSAERFENSVPYGLGRKRANPKKTTPSNDRDAEHADDHASGIALRRPNLAQSTGNASRTRRLYDPNATFGLSELSRPRRSWRRDRTSMPGARS